MNEDLMLYTIIGLFGTIFCIMVWSMWHDYKSGYIPRRRESGKDSSIDAVDVAVISGIMSSCD